MDILPHLKHFSDEHLRVHGKTKESRKYLADSIAMWKDCYGPVIGGKMEIHIRDAWAKSKAKPR